MEDFGIYTFIVAEIPEHLDCALPLKSVPATRLVGDMSRSPMPENILTIQARVNDFELPLNEDGSIKYYTTAEDAYAASKNTLMLDGRTPTHIWIMRKVSPQRVFKNFLGLAFHAIVGRRGDVVIRGGDTPTSVDSSVFAVLAHNLVVYIDWPEWEKTDEPI